MTNMRKAILFTTAAAMGLALSACGGGGYSSERRAEAENLNERGEAL